MTSQAGKKGGLNGTLKRVRRARDDRNSIDLIRLLYALAPIELVTGLFIAAGVVFALWHVVPRSLLETWFGFILLFSALRLLLIFRYRRRPLTAGTLRRWGALHALISGFAGASWGMLGWLGASYGTLAEQIFVALAIGCMVAVTYATTVSARSSLIAFMVPALAPSAAWFLAYGSEIYAAAGVAIIAIAAVLSFATRRLQITLAKTFTLARENAELLQKMAASKEQADQTGRELDGANQALKAEIAKREQAERKITASEKELRALLWNMQDTLFRADLAGIITWVSPSVRTLLEYTPEELLGCGLADLHADAQAYLEFRRALDKNGLIENHPLIWKRRDNQITWVSVNAQYYYNENDVIAGIEGSARDITERKLAEEALFQEKERAQITLRCIGDGVITTRTTGEIEYLNPTAEHLIGCGLDEARGRSLFKVVSLVDNTTGQAMPDPVAQCLQQGKTQNLSGHILLVRANDRKSFSVEVTVAPIHDSTGHTAGTVLVFHDVTELRGLVHKMSYQASHDALTGLINRREFEARLNRALDSARDHGLRHALCYMDLDQFKIVNDTCGHAAGDELLKQLAMQLQERIRETDTLGRLGGDEFGVLLEGCPLDRAHEIAEVLRRTVEDFHFQWKDKIFRVGVSIGLVPITADSGELSDVLSAADSACYVAKEQGRNRVRVFQADDTALAQRSGEMHWVQRIQWALEENRFRLYFQPVVSLKNGDQEQHVQLLLRLLNEHDQLISPQVFLPAAERYHLTVSIDRWVVNTALRTLATHETTLKNTVTCIINLSGQSLAEEDFLDFIVERLEATHVETRRLCFQVPESAVINHMTGATNFIATLKRLGCRFSLANFGSGLSSFGYLKALNVDYLKLDGNFVKGMVQDPVDRAMVRAVNQLGHALGVRTIAEFVENEATFKSLRLLNVDFVQGYWLDQPRPFPPESAD